MKIQKLEVKGFGKFESLSLTFDRGFNIVFGENEAGKTTIQQFIKAMLYGLKGGRSGKDGAPPPLKKYKPWKSGDFSGYMEYSLDCGEVFRIGRDFAANRVRVFDSMFNDVTGSFEVSKDKVPQVCEKHLGLNEACFDKTVFIRQTEVKIGDDGSRELRNKLLNVAQTGFEELSFNKAREALEKTLKDSVGTGKTSTRPFDRVSSRLAELAARKNALERDRDCFNEMQSELSDARSRKLLLEEEKDALSKLAEAVALRKEADRLQEILELNSTLASIRSERENDTISDLGMRIKAGQRKTKLLKLLAAICGVFCLAFSAGALFYSSLRAVLYAASAAALFASGLSLLAGKGLREKLALLESQKSSVSRNTIRSAEGVRTSETKAAELESRIAEIIAGLEQAQVVRGFAGFSLDILKKTNPLGALDGVEKSVSARLDTLNAELSGSISRIAQLEAAARTLASDNEDLQLVEEEIACLERQRVRLADAGTALKIALDVLTEASLEIQKDFVPVLNREMSGVMERITHGRYKDLRANNQLSLCTVFPDTGDVVETPFLSGGTVDQVYLALRLSMARLMSGSGESLPLLMDEVFAYYDDTRTREAIGLLKDLSSDTQIILFTCKRREVEVAAGVFGGSLNLLEL